MFNFIISDFYRLLNKKSNYIFFSIIFVSIFIVMLINKINLIILQSGFEERSFQTVLIFFMIFSYIYISINSFVSIYGDDVSTKQIHHIFAKLSSKRIYVIAKLIVLAIYVLFAYAFFLLLYFLLFFALNYGLYKDMNVYMEKIHIAFGMSLTAYITSLVYVSLASVILYLTSKPNLTITCLILLMFKFFLFIYTILSTFLKPLELLSPFLFSNVINEVWSPYKNNFTITYLVILGFIYVISCVIANIIILDRLDLK